MFFPLNSVVSFSAGNHFVVLLVEGGGSHVMFSEDYSSLRMMSVASKATWLKMLMHGCELWKLNVCCFYRASQGQWARRDTPGPPGYKGSQDCKAAKVTRVKRGLPGSQDRRETWYVQ